MAGRGRPRMPRAVEREFWREIGLGLSTEDAAAAVGVSNAVGKRWFGNGGGMPTLELSEPAGRGSKTSLAAACCRGLAPAHDG